MKEVCVLVPTGEAVLSSIVGPFKLFNAANQFVRQRDPEAIPPFDVKLLGISSQTDLYGGSFLVRPHLILADNPRPDLIIIPAIQGNIHKEMENNKEFVPWIAERYKEGSEIASMCVGAFLLASSGLLDGKCCTTHWAMAGLFRETFPRVTLLSEKIITDENGLYTSGGAYSFLNLMLYLVEKYAGRDIAIKCAKYFEVDMDRYNQSQFAIFSGQKEHADDPVLKAQNYIEANVGEKLKVDDLANMCAISRRNFIRRFKKATHNTPLEYIQRAKVEAAKKSLESSGATVYEVMYKVGYSDSKAFRNLFRKFTGLTPNEYRSKYNRSQAMA